MTKKVFLFVLSVLICMLPILASYVLPTLEFQKQSKAVFNVEDFIDKSGLPMSQNPQGQDNSANEPRSDEIVIPEQDADVFDDLVTDVWIGGYFFFESSPPPDTGSTIMMSYSISIYEWKDNLYAYIAIDGWGTSKRLRAKVLCHNNEAVLLFDEYMKDHLDGYFCEEETILISLMRRETDITTTWGKLQPILPENESPGKYFLIEPDANSEFSPEMHNQTVPIIEVG